MESSTPICERISNCTFPVAPTAASSSTPAARPSRFSAIPNLSPSPKMSASGSIRRSSSASAAMRRRPSIQTYLLVYYEKWAQNKAHVAARTTGLNSSGVPRRKSMKRLARWIVLCAPLVCLVCATVPANAQSGAKNGEWRTYGGDLASTRYSPLDQINADNFNKLAVAWRFKTDSLGPRPEFKFEATPLMVNGVVYSTGGSRRAVVALDATAGGLLLMHSGK